MAHKPTITFLQDTSQLHSKNENAEWIKVTFEGPVFKPFSFRADINTPMDELEKLYSAEMGVPLNLLRFVFDGCQFSKYDTLKQLYIKDSDIIEVYLSATGPCSLCGDHVTSYPGYIILRFYGTDKKMMDFIVNATILMGELTKLYSGVVKIPLGFLRFHCNEQPFSDNDTPRKLKIHSGAIINVNWAEKPDPCDDSMEDTNYEYINIKLQGIDKKMIDCIIKTNTPMNELTKSYSNKVGIPIRFLNFRFNGCLFLNDSTPLQLHLKNGDVIEVYKAYEVYNQSKKRKCTTSGEVLK